VWQVEAAIAHCRMRAGFPDLRRRNIMLPDDRAAIVVLTNQDGTNASGVIGQGVLPLLLETADSFTPQKLERARKIFTDLQHGTIDRSLFTDNANAYFSPQALKDFADSLGPLGVADEVVQISQSLRGGMAYREYRIKIGEKNLSISTFEMPDGRLEQYQIVP
jgi:D-alanyl-D-alanine carboxypeptidase